MDSPGEREIHGWISLVLQAQRESDAQKAGARRKMCAGVLYSTLRSFFECNAVDAGTCFASLLCSQVQGSPSVANPLGGQRAHWTRCSFRLAHGRTITWQGLF